jgi:Leucine-rich repeat (LRR) protein
LYKRDFQLQQLLLNQNNYNHLYIRDYGLTRVKEKLKLNYNLNELTSLTALELGSNQLTTIPSELGQLQSLIHLNLSSNQLTSIPSELGQLKSLTRLN